MGQYVQFDEGPDIEQVKAVVKKKSWPTKLVRYLPGINTDAKANTVLLIIALVFFAVSVIILWNLLNLSKSTENARLADVLTQEELNTLPDSLRQALLNE
ncbi:MAG: hypothetical protein MRY49_00930 [Candidatus Pacebacteria bacterium]|nr:hypothetical protein [Candidatus Paceibacterota bacterium]